MSEFSHHHLISKRALARKPSHFATIDKSPPKGFKPADKNLILSWGTPNDGFFPIESIDLQLVDYPFEKALSMSMTNASLESLALSKTNGTVANDSLGPKKISIKRRSEDPKLIDIANGLQYSDHRGHAQILQFTRDFISKVHPPSYADWDTIITTGASDGLNRVADTFLNPGDVILVEEFTFTPFLSHIANSGGIPVPVKMNLDPTPDKSNGLDIEYLTDLLENWDTKKPDLKKPKVLYTIPTGQNPTGLTQSVEFRKKVYALAEKHDFIIVEDDPYGYLTLPPFLKPEGVLKLDLFLTVEEYLAKHLVPSYLNLDTSGRVVRIETFSKLFAPGVRVGFLVAHKKVIEVILQFAAVVTRAPSGVSQMVLNNVIEQKYKGVDGWLQWILKMRLTYTHRRDVLVNAIVELDAYKKKYVSFIDPRAGMFLSLVVNFPPGTPVVEKIKLLNWKFLAYGVHAVPGINMAADPEFSKDTGNFFRLTFAPANTDEELNAAGTQLAKAVTDFFEKGLEF
jgi:aromatic amino acid aminotransferase II